MSKTKRIQVLMEPAEFAALERIAKAEGTSVAELMRGAVRALHPALRAPKRRALAAERFLSLPEAPLPDWLELKKELEDRREPGVH